MARCRNSAATRNARILRASFCAPAAPWARVCRRPLPPPTLSSSPFLPRIYCLYPMHHLPPPPRMPPCEESDCAALPYALQNRAHLPQPSRLPRRCHNRCTAAVTSARRCTPHRIALRAAAPRCRTLCRLPPLFMARACRATACSALPSCRAVPASLRPRIAMPGCAGYHREEAICALPLLEEPELPCDLVAWQRSAYETTPPHLYLTSGMRGRGVIILHVCHMPGGAPSLAALKHQNIRDAP